MSDPVETAERLSQRRARMLPVLALFLLLQQATFFSNTPGTRAVDMVRTGGWMALAAVVLAVLVGGGFWRRPAAVRELMNDEGTRANRADALAWGFVLGMGAAIALYGVVAFTASAVTVREALHLIATTGLAAACIRFAMLERRAHKLG